MTCILPRAAAPAGCLTASTNSTPTCDSPKCRNCNAMARLFTRCSVESGKPLRRSTRSCNDQRSRLQSNRPASPIPRRFDLRRLFYYKKLRPSQLTMRLSDAGLHQHQTKAVYPDHRLPPWLTEGPTRDRSNRLLAVEPQRVTLRPRKQETDQHLARRSAKTGFPYTLQFQFSLLVDGALGRLQGTLLPANLAQRRCRRQTW